MFFLAFASECSIWPQGLKKHYVHSRDEAMVHHEFREDVGKKKKNQKVDFFIFNVRTTFPLR